MGNIRKKAAPARNQKILRQKTMSVKAETSRQAAKSHSVAKVLRGYFQA